ncbi:MAG: type III pantothenate kinase [Bacteroidota bacterium]
MSWRLYVDIGNSAMKFSARQAGAWVCSLRIEWEEACDNEMLDPATFTVARVLNELSAHDLHVADCEAILACGSSADADMVYPALSDGFNQPVRVLGQDLQAKLKSKYRPAKSLGADRVANAVGAFGLYGGPVIVVDAGSCLTAEIVDAEGTFVGGYIAAGMPALMEGIIEVSPHLEGAFEQDELPEDEFIGQTTTECLMVGTAIQMNATVHAFIATAREYLEQPEAMVIITGGLCEYLTEGFEDERIAANALLTLEGLRLIDGYE